MHFLQRLTPGRLEACNIEIQHCKCFTPVLSGVLPPWPPPCACAQPPCFACNTIVTTFKPTCCTSVLPGLLPSCAPSWPRAPPHQLTWECVQGQAHGPAGRNHQSNHSVCLARATKHDSGSRSQTTLEVCKKHSADMGVCAAPGVRSCKGKSAKSEGVTSLQT
jgi:hypothetical protein